MSEGLTFTQLQEKNASLVTANVSLMRRVSELEEQLSQRDAQIAALTAENVSKTIRLQQLINIVEHADNRYCMCGDSMESHGSVGGCGSPTGMFDYHYGKWLETSVENPATDAAANALRAEGAAFVATAIRACIHEFPDSAEDIVEECAMIADNRAVNLREGKA